VGDVVASWSGTGLIVRKKLDAFWGFFCGREGISRFEEVSSSEGEGFPGSGGFNCSRGCNPLLGGLFV
jgi:hypothetical protein